VRYNQRSVLITLYYKTVAKYVENKYYLLYVIYVIEQVTRILQSAVVFL